MARRCWIAWVALGTVACGGELNSGIVTAALDAGVSTLEDSGWADGGGSGSDGGFVLEDAGEAHVSTPEGWPEAICAVPEAAAAVDTSDPDHVVGDGTPHSCTSRAFVDAVALGGTIVFDCGPDPVTIALEETARVINDQAPDVVIDGGGLVTLSGGGERRILYMNTCDPELVWTTPRCDNQDHPRLTVQNLDFIDGYVEGEDIDAGGAAIYARGGRLKVVDSRFFRNRIAGVGADVAGAAIRAFQQYEKRPVYVTGSVFGGSEAQANSGSNGGALGSIDVSWTITNTHFSHNVATGYGANPAQAGTPGGGSGGAIYNDGETMTLSLCGVVIEHNRVNAHGSAIFFVSNSHTGTIRIDRSVIRNNEGGTWYEIAPQISGWGDTDFEAVDSIIE